MYDVEPCLQIRSNSIVAYNYYPRRSLTRSLAQKQSEESLRTEILYGYTSSRCKKRLIKVIEHLVMLTKKRTKCYQSEKVVTSLNFGCLF